MNLSGSEDIYIELEIRKRLATLTPREYEVFLEVAKGIPNKQSAHILGCALRTLKRHREVVMRKMGVRSAAELARMAERLERKVAVVRNDENSLEALFERATKPHNKKMRRVAERFARTCSCDPDEIGSPSVRLNGQHVSDAHDRLG